MQIYTVDKLNFPRYKFRFKSKENKRYVFDNIRKKWLLLTPEEWVRQHCVGFLTETKNYPKSLVSVEKKITVYKTKKRYDVVVYKSDKTVSVLVECKSPSTQIEQTSFDQIARYNLPLKSDYLMLSNGFEHYYCLMDYEKKTYRFIRELPDYTK